jgi:hypothetical protein
MTLTDKLNGFAAMLERQQLQHLILEDLACFANQVNCKVRVIPGRKFTKVDVGSSGKYMVENETGVIFGIKAYGQVHKGHRYGTLDTINDFWWGEYRGISLRDSFARATFDKAQAECPNVGPAPEKDKEPSAYADASLKVGDKVAVREYTDITPGTVISRTGDKAVIRLHEFKLINKPDSGLPDAMQVTPGGFCAHWEGKQRNEVLPETNAGEVVVTLRGRFGDNDNVWRKTGYQTRDLSGLVYNDWKYTHHDYNF